MKKTLIILLLCVYNIAVHAQFEGLNIGDIIDIGGVKSIVFQVDDSGCHGKAMAVKPLRGVKNMWCNDSKLAASMPSTTNESDGLSNTNAIIEYGKSHHALSSFPVYEWCSKLGDGWYVPSLKELEDFVNFWIGNNQVLDWDAEEETEYALDDSKPFYKQINVKLLDAGGTPFLNGVFTSTVNAEDKVYVFWFNQKKNSWSFGKRSKDKLSKYYVGRAFYNF